MTLPEEFIRYTRDLMGDERFARLAEGLQQESPVSIRLNPAKCEMAGTSVADSDGHVAWCATGTYLRSRPNFTFDPLLHGGMYYVQEASSMFVDHVLRQVTDGPSTVLDLCAAPGGKSTACRAALPDHSVLVSNEPVRTRANILSENMQKQGHPDIIVTNNLPRDFRRAGLAFDIILADVPCSGEGMFRKDDEAVRQWSPQLVSNCSRLQRDIVADIWPCLRPGGILIYSTCTFNAHENEENAEWIASVLGAEFVSIATQAEWNIQPALTRSCAGYRFLPGTTRGEGLFMTVLRKNGKSERAMPTGDAAKPKRKSDTPAELPLKDPTAFVSRQRGDKPVAIPRRWADIYDRVDKHLNVIHAGITIGTRKGRDLLPDQSLALSTMLDRKAFAAYELDAAQAIAYLRKEAPLLPDGTPKGFVLLTHRGLPIGWAKNIGSRANNLYPQEWKIKSSHLPDDNIIIIKEYETIS